MTRILLGQLGSNGDCLYATTIARQIKHDFPDCHLTWAISSLCRRVIENNPHVDDVWEIKATTWLEIFGPGWFRFETEAWNRVARGEYDHAFLTQICPSNFGNYDGTIRPSVFRNYPRPITVPVESVIRLTDEEKNKVEQWAKQVGIASGDKMVLFECASKSGQSFVTPEHAVRIAENVLAKRPNTCFVLSTHLPIDLNDPRMIHGGALGLRETAQLSHYADLFVGCGSGVTVAVTSEAAKKNLPNIQILQHDTSVYASFRHDFEYFSKPSGHFLETTSEDVDGIAETIITALDDGIEAAKARFDERLTTRFDWYFTMIRQNLLDRQCYLEAAHSLGVTLERYGRRDDLLSFGRDEILPHVRDIARQTTGETEVNGYVVEQAQRFQELLELPRARQLV
jgi:hypothetical protein